MNIDNMRTPKSSFDEVTKYSVWVTCVCLILLTIYVGWGTFVDGYLVRQPAIYWSGSLVTEGDTYCPGEILRVRIITTKTRPIHGTVSWTMNNVNTRIMINFSKRDTSLPMGYSDAFVEIGAVPEYAPTGTWKLIGMVHYPVNPFRDIVYNLISTEFKVRPCGDIQ